MRRRQLLHTAITLPLLTAIRARAQAAQWRSGPAVPINTQELYATVHDGELVVAGGIAARLGVPYFTDACFAFNPVQQQWRELAALPEARHHVALISCQGRLFALGGFHGSYSSVWQMRDSVLELTHEGWRQAGRLPAPQAEGVVTCHQQTIHLVTGQSPKGDANAARSDHTEVGAHWRWDPGDDRWQTAAPIPTPRNSASGGWVGDQMIVAGGRTASGNLDVTEVYDAGQDRWRTAAPMPLPQAGTAGVAVADGLIVFGGEIFAPTATVFPNVWHYSLPDDEWTPLPDLPTPRHGLGAGRIGNEIYVIGGATKPGGSGTSDANDILTYID